MKSYSYFGRRKKLAFNVYFNIKTLIVKASARSFMTQTELEVGLGGTEEETAEEIQTKMKMKEKKLKEIEKSADDYFISEYIKHAKQRYDNSVSKNISKAN